MADRTLVFLGGGHSHAIVLRRWAMAPLPNLRLILITDTVQAPYSGMLPGHVAGFYRFEQTHINMIQLCQQAGVELYLDRAVGLDLANQQVLCADRPPVTFDLLSIDIGSTPQLADVPGAADQVIPAKPVSGFLNTWQRLQTDLKRTTQFPMAIAIVGGGAGGVELALAMQGGLERLWRQMCGLDPADLNDPEGDRPWQLHLLHRGTEIMGSHHPRVRQQLTHIVQAKGIQLHLGQRVTAVHAGQLHCASGLTLTAQPIIWVTQASAPAWVAASGLSTDEHGFIAVENTLRSQSHPNVFAAGDIASLIQTPCPKAGVFAVRQGFPLFTNLQRWLNGAPLMVYHPQQTFLNLIGTGDGRAIASWGNWGWGPSRTLWVWKDWLDQRFMQQFGH